MWLVALPWIGVPIVVVSGVVLPVGLHLQALALSACAGVGLLLSRLAVRETCQSFEQKLKELRFAQEDLLERMIAYGEANEGTTCEDMRVIRNIATLIALRLTLSDDEAEAIGLAAAVHDVGKIAIPAGVLRKPTHLSADELELVKTHTIIGERIIGSSPQLQLEREVARHHHERWDGTGYPDGLRGGEIPLVARITAVADVFEALITRRRYKEPWQVKDAVQYIKAMAGSQFDPMVVRAFESLYESGELPLPLSTRVPLPFAI